MVAKIIPRIGFSVKIIEECMKAFSDLERAMEQFNKIVQKRPYPQSNGQLYIPIRPFLRSESSAISLWETISKIRLKSGKNQLCWYKDTGDFQ